MDTIRTGEMTIESQRVNGDKDQHNFYADPDEVTIQLFTGSASIHLHLTSEQADAYANELILAAARARIMARQVAEEIESGVLVVS